MARLAFLLPALLASTLGAAPMARVKPIWVTTLPQQQGRIYAMGIASSFTEVYLLSRTTPTMSSRNLLLPR